MTRRRPHLPAGRRLQATFLGLLLGLGGLVAVPAAAAAAPPTSSSPRATTSSPTPSSTSTPTPTSTSAPSSDDALTIRLDQVSPQVLSLGEDLQVTVTVTNTGSTTVDKGTVSLLLRRYRLASRAELDAWLDGSTSASGSGQLARVPLGAPLEPGASASVQLVASAASIRLLNVWGPRGLLVRASGSGLSGELRTFLLWQSTEDIPSTQVALVAPVVGPAGLGSTATSAPTATGTPAPTSSPTDGVAAAPVDRRLAALVAPQGRLNLLLKTAQAVPELGLAVDPALLQAARADGAAPAAWAGQLTGLLTDGRDAIALPWADPDLTALAAAGRSELLSTARAQAAAAVPELSGDLVWTGPGQLDGQTAELARAAGASRLLVPGTGNGEPDSGVATTSTAAGELTVLRADGQLGALATGSSAGGPAAQLRALAILAVAARDGSGADRTVIAAGRDWVADPAAFTAFAAALRQAPWVHLTSTADLVTSGRTTTIRLPSTAPAPTGLATTGQVDALSDATVQLQSLALATDDPTSLTDDLDRALVAPLSVAYRAAPTERSAAVQSALAAAGDRFAALSLPARTDITVISSSSEVRIAVRNDLSTPATVRVRISPAKACLAPSLSAPVTVPAGTQAAVPVRLVAHANCKVRVSAQLLAADGSVLPVAPLTFSATLSPTIENVGTAVVGALLAVGLVLGIWRTIRRGQSARRGARRVPEDEVTSLGVLGGEPTPRHGTVAGPTEAPRSPDGSP